MFKGVDSIKVETFRKYSFPVKRTAFSGFKDFIWFVNKFKLTSIHDIKVETFRKYN